MTEEWAALRPTLLASLALCVACGSRALAPGPEALGPDAAPRDLPRLDALQTDQPRPDLDPHRRFVELAVRGCVGCAIRDDARMACWGEDPQFIHGLPQGLFKSVDVHGSWGCAVRVSGELVCWGDGLSPLMAIVPAGSYSTVRVSSSGSCALRSDGRPTCWGHDGPAPIEPPEETLVSLSLEDRHACGLTKNHSVRCWGVPKLMYGLHGASSGPLLSVAAGFRYYTCGVRQIDSGLMCWEGKWDNILDRWSSDPFPGERFRDVEMGRNHACALESGGSIKCWPRGPEYRGESETLQAAAILKRVPSGAGYARVTVGWGHACALHQDGRIDCWGENDCGQLDAPDPNALP